MSQVTKRALEASLKNLLLQKPLSKITISDITEDCGINHMTFYYYFKDIYNDNWKLLFGTLSWQEQNIKQQEMISNEK